MEKNSEKLPGWEYLNEIGRRYYELVQQGHGTTLENRCDEQIRIINEIAQGIYPFLIKIAKELLNDKHKLKTKAGEKYLSLKWVKNKSNINYSSLDLANEAIVYVIESFNQYKPNKSSISTFLDIKATHAMYKYGLENYRTVKAPAYRFNDFKKIDKKTSFEEQLDKIRHKDRISQDRLHYVYLTQRQAPIAIEDSYEHVIWKMEDNIILGGALEKNKLENKIKNIMASELNERERNILSNSTEEKNSLEKIGKDLGITKQRVSQIKKVAIKKLRNPAIISSLKEFL